MPSGYTTSERVSRYRPLVDFLAATREDVIVLTFAKVAAIIGGRLPESAAGGTSWWTSKSNTHVAMWRSIGWRARCDCRNRCVHFTHDTGE